MLLTTRPPPTRPADDYLVDHTIFFYLMGPDGLIRAYYGKHMTSEEVSTGILQVMDDELPPSRGWLSWFK